MLILAESVAAQTTADSSWQPAVEARLQAIYDRDAFRPQAFQAEWLPDSSGYTVEERDNTLFRKPETYHVGIAVVPKPQPHLYNAWFQEIFMQTREVNPDGYQRAAPIGYADGLKGKLLIITGSAETNTHIQIIEGLVDRLIELGKPFDFMVYPNRDHGLREGKGTLVHVRMLIARHFVQHLPAGPRPRGSPRQSSRA